MIGTLNKPAIRYNLGRLEQIPVGEGRVFPIGGREIAVFRPREGGLYATQADCPHLGGPLADGLVGGGQVICPLHAYKFRLSDGKSVGNTCTGLATYRVWVNAAGRILVELDR